MKRVNAILILILKSVALLSLSLLYRFSSFLFYIFYYLFSYRKKVVRKNLILSFPEKTLAEIIQIEKKFYRHFFDLIVETIKLASIRKADLKKRIQFDEPTLKLINQSYQQNENLIFVLGHYGNWEWALQAGALFLPFKQYGLYRPLNNKNFNNFIIDLRQQFGAELISEKQALRRIASIKNDLKNIAFIADQSPFPELAEWINFLNQDTPIFSGPAKISKMFNYPIIYFTINKIKRGHYLISGEEIFDPKSTDLNELEIMKLFFKRLEDDIKKQPEYWLWTHKRWKYKRPL